MLASLIIIGFSLLLFLYWFRYTCLLVLSTKTAKDYTRQVARANQLEFPDVETNLRGTVAFETLDDIQRSLDRDYRLITGLLQHACDFQLGGVTLEQRMLMIDYRVMKLWYWLSKKLARAVQSKQALEEMAGIVAHFANTLGERAAASARY